MAEIRVKDNESLDSALRRFKRSCAKAGVLSEVRKREHYEKPSVRRKRNPRLLENVSSDNFHRRGLPSPFLFGIKEVIDYAREKESVIRPCRKL